MKKTVINIVLLALLLALVIPEKITAIPAFARKYQISCQVCHSPAMPRLKGFGEEFAGNGFRMTDYESPRHFIETGDDKLSLFRELPLALRLDAFASYNFGNKGATDFSSPFILKILSGGEISDKFSYYFYFFFNERGTIAGIEDAFLMYHDFLGSGVNLYLGQFAVSDPLFKGELRYTLEPYKIYSVSPGNSTADLKYDRGIIFEKDFRTGTALTGEIVNGNGIGEADDYYLFDKDKYKNFMLKVTQSIGENVSAGFFAYTGKEVLSDPGLIYQDVTNNIKMYGPDLILNFDEKLIIGLQYLWRSDSHIFDYTGEAPLRDIKTHGGFAEIIYAPRGDMSKWYFTGLLNLVESDYNEADYSSGTLHVGYLLRRNMRVVAEFTRRFSGISYSKINAGIITAF
ncbi:MAG TPA: hypothetical protein DDW27_21140 [Bacteroidales bacterium]|nr:hypothetical protein [Bacteroidales bacterium]